MVTTQTLVAYLNGLKDEDDHESARPLIDVLNELAKSKPRKSPIFTDRRYNVVGFRLSSGQVESVENVTIHKARLIQKKLRKQCYRVDLIEVESKVAGDNGEKITLEFTEKNYVPALEGKIPGNATYHEDSRRLKDGRIRSHNKLAEKLARSQKSIETRKSLSFRAYDRNTHKLIIATDNETDFVKYLMRNHIKANEIIIEGPRKLIEKL